MENRYLGSGEGIKRVSEAPTEEMEKLMKMMEEMAGDKMEHGKRTPGEKGKYEQ